MTTTDSLFEPAYRQTYSSENRTPGRMPWDIGGPQPAVVALAEAGEFGGDVLDIGCGLGGNAIFLASRGYRVTGLDNAATAIRLATEDAARRDLTVTFAVADATSLAGYEDSFDSILDSGLFHCLDEESRRAYMSALARVGKPEARLHILSFTDALPEGTPLRVSEELLRRHVTAPWVIERLSQVRYQTSMSPDELHENASAMAADQNADLPVPDLFTDLDTDGDGQAYFPAWHLVARLTGK